MKIRNSFQRLGSTMRLPALAAAGLFALLSPLAVQSANAQLKVKLAPPGNSLDTPEVLVFLTDTPRSAKFAVRFRL